MKDLTVHHLIPRADDGTNDPENLITLCFPCHDFVEINDIRTIDAIKRSYEESLPVEIIKVDDTPVKEESFERPEWHKYVYGGMKHHDQEKQNLE